MVQQVKGLLYTHGDRSLAASTHVDVCHGAIGLQYEKREQKQEECRGSLRDLVSNQGAELFGMSTTSSTHTHIYEELMRMALLDI